VGEDAGAGAGNEAFVGADVGVLLAEGGLDGLVGPEFDRLLRRHLEQIGSVTAPEARHARFLQETHTPVS
jgi:hypothetical protein